MSEDPKPSRTAASQRPRRSARLAAPAALAALALMASPGIAQATSTTTTFAPAADAEVRAAQPAQNFGSRSSLASDKDPLSESYVKFEVTGISGPVQSAVVRLRAIDQTGNGPLVKTTGADWTEGGLKYDNRPATTSATLDNRGSIKSSTWIQYDVTRAVAGDGTYSFVLIPESRDGVEFASRETTSYRPELKLTYDAPSTADASPPTASISSPASGTVYTSAGSYGIEADVRDDVAVTKVEFFDNGRLAGTEDTAPFGYSWAITSADNGSHRWTIKAYDAAGNSTSSAPVDVTVDIAEDTTSTTSGGTGTITAKVETDPMPHSGDAADDAAVWIHPTDTSKSTIIGTDKLGGLAVYDLAGRQLSYTADSSPNNVDLRYNFPLGSGRSTLVATSDHAADTIRLYTVDAGSRALQHVSARSIGVGIGIYGLCMYRSPSTGKYYVFDSDSSGTVQQWELYDAGSGKVDAKKVRQFTVGSTTEGCVADDELGHFYIAEEDVGIWKYNAEPGGGTSRTKVDGLASAGGHLTADVEGLSIYYGSGGRGHLLASSQGDNTYAVYDRAGANPFQRSFSVAAGTVDGVTYTDGIDVTNAALGGAFPYGVFVAQDDRNDTGNQNFKLVPWEQIARAAEPHFIVDTTWDPRLVGAPSDTTTTTTESTTTTTESTTTESVSTGSTGTTYYLDAQAGDDTKSGTSPDAAWKSLSRASTATLAPGDSLLLKRGQSWTGTLTMAESGTSTAPVSVGAFGSGDAPVIRGATSCVDLSGSHLVVTGLTIGGCSWAGVRMSGSSNRVEQNLITGNAAGVDVKAGATGNRILRNLVKDNNKMSVLTADIGNDDSGAFGILLKGDKTEVAYNTISGSDAFSYDYGRDGAAVEIYGAQGSSVHHNVARDNDAFAELGNSRSADNAFAYNEVTSVLDTSVFLVTRGAESSYGPVMRTNLENNTVRFTGGSSQGVVCHAGCSTDILRMRNNVVEAVKKAIYADARPDEDYSVFFGGAVQTTIGPNSRITDPKFVNPTGGDLRLAAGSPGVDRGTAPSHSTDLDGAAVPSDGDGDGSALPDIGAFERH